MSADRSAPPDLERIEQRLAAIQVRIDDLATPKWYAQNAFLMNAADDIEFLLARVRALEKELAKRDEPPY